MAELVAVEDGRIVYVGARRRGAASWATTPRPSTLRARRCFPASPTAHVHVIGVGSRERNLNLEDVASIAELQAARGRGGVGRHRLNHRRARLDRDPLAEGRFPTAADLDAVEAERPVVLVRADGHALVANTAAMKPPASPTRRRTRTAARFCAMKPAPPPA
jgi:predicted amidohydrolase YtcJ